MKNYMKPDVFVTEFQVNEAIAACDRVVTGTETTTVYEKQTVYCDIGNQYETVFNAASSCSTSANQWGIAESGGEQYFVWFTYAGDTGSGQPDQTKVDFLNSLVQSLGFSAGSGWHYAEVTGTDIVTDVLGFSF